MGYTITLIAGIALLVASLFVFQKSLAFLKRSNRSTGTVIDLEAIRDSDGTTYKPIFKFKTDLNKEIIVKHNSSSNPVGWKIGEEVTIAYDPIEPTKAKALTYFSVFSWTIILMAFAMPAIVIGGGYYVSKYFLK